MTRPPRIVLLTLFSIGCLSVLATSPPAFAQDSTPKTAADYARAAQTAFEAGQFAAADKALDDGLAIDAKSHALLRLRGEIRLAVRDFEGALAAYEAYLAAKPRGANRRKARKIIANLSASRTTVLTITVNSGPANIYLDSKSLGVYCVAEPTCKKGMLPGRYRVFVERDGFHPKTENVRLRLGKTEALSVELVEKNSPLTVSVVPGDAAITLDGKPLEKDSEGAVVVAPGEHTVEATLNGFVTAKQTVTAAQGKPVIAELALDELVSITVTPPSATLTLDGEEVTLTDGRLAIPSDQKPHTLVANADRFRERTVTIPPTRERGATIAVELEEIPVVVEPPPPAPTPGWSRGRTWLFAGLIAASSVGVIAGTATGLSANSNWNDAEERCVNDRCDARGLELVDTAQSRATQSNIAFGVALAAAFGAGVVYFTAPKAESIDASGPTVTPTVGANQAGLLIRGEF